MNDIACTAWFDGRTKPAQEGVYQRGSDTTSHYACWNGRSWNDDAASPSSAAQKREVSPTQDAPWRGLVERSGAPCGTCGGHTIVDRGHDVETGADLLAECPDC